MGILSFVESLLRGRTHKGVTLAQAECLGSNWGPRSENMPPPSPQILLLFFPALIFYFKNQSAALL